MLRILIVVTCIKISTLASAQSKGTTSFDEDANSDEPDHPSEYINIFYIIICLTHKFVMRINVKICLVRVNQVIYCLTCQHGRCRANQLFRIHILSSLAEFRATLSGVSNGRVDIDKYKHPCGAN